MRRLDRLIAAVERLDWFPPLFARIVVGAVFIHSGWGKLHHLDGVIRFFESLGIPAPELQAPFVASIEFFCGSLLFLGLAARFASIPLIATMVVAILTAKRSDLEGINDLFNLSEFLFIPLLVWIVVRGAGLISLDQWLRHRCDKSLT